MSALERLLAAHVTIDLFEGRSLGAKKALYAALVRNLGALEARLAGIDATSDEAAETRRKISDLRLDVALRIEAMAKRAKG